MIVDGQGTCRYYWLPHLGLSTPEREDMEGLEEHINAEASLEETLQEA